MSHRPCQLRETPRQVFQRNVHTNKSSIFCLLCLLSFVRFSHGFRSLLRFDLLTLTFSLSVRCPLRFDLLIFNLFPPHRCLSRLDLLSFNLFLAVRCLSRFDWLIF